MTGVNERGQRICNLKYDGYIDIYPDFVTSSGILSGCLLLSHFTLTQGELLQGKALQDFVIDKIDDLKGQDIVAIDVHGKSSITDCMVICTGTSTRHVMSIADHVVQESRAAGMLPLGVEGEAAADWIVVDLGDVMVHVMQEESRRLYELEKLWS
ncbi:Ribosomal silencing factor RsfS [Klebsiella huaxiensis]|uniref:Ribosomal silencing factor RsfS n=4 Tax=Enterobacterales TaxID=91347 RepID=A0A564GRS4_9ENTR|nr:Ribosomal silencing factor RsfS [Klebsiella huaxiensis]